MSFQNNMAKKSYPYKIIWSGYVPSSPHKIFKSYTTPMTSQADRIYGGRQPLEDLEEHVVRERRRGVLLRRWLSRARASRGDGGDWRKGTNARACAAEERSGGRHGRMFRRLDGELDGVEARRWRIWAYRLRTAGGNPRMLVGPLSALEMLIFYAPQPGAPIPRVEPQMGRPSHAGGRGLFFMFFLFSVLVFLYFCIFLYTLKYSTCIYVYILQKALFKKNSETVERSI